MLSRAYAGRIARGRTRCSKPDRPPQPRDWSRDIHDRQESIRGAYLRHAEALAQGDADDRQLARDIRRFVADMPVPLTRRQAMAVELRRVLEQQPGRQAPFSSPAAEGLHGASPKRAADAPRQELDAPKPRRRRDRLETVAIPLMGAMPTFE